MGRRFCCSHLWKIQPPSLLTDWWIPFSLKSCSIVLKYLLLALSTVELTVWVWFVICWKLGPQCGSVKVVVEVGSWGPTLSNMINTILREWVTSHRTEFVPTNVGCCKWTWNLLWIPLLYLPLNILIHFLAIIMASAMRPSSERRYAYTMLLCLQTY